MKPYRYILISALICLSTITIRASSYSESVTDKSNEINLYPNPIKNGEVLTIDSDKNIYRIEIMNIVGQLMKIEDYSETSNVKLNIEELKEGIYIVKILFADNTTSTKRLWVK